MPLLTRYERFYDQLGRIYHLSQLYQETGLSKQALTIAMEGKKMSEQIKQAEYSLDFEKLLATIYASMGESASAYKHLTEHLLLKDSLFQQEKEKSMQEMETRYQTEKKDQEIAQLNQQKALQEAALERQALIRNGALAAVLLIGLIGFAGYRNVRIRQRNQQQLLRQQKELDQAKSRFFANIAHEFRTPLTLIQGPAEQIGEQTQDPLVRKLSLLIERHSKQLLGLIHQILDLSKLESGMVKLESKPGEFVGFLKGLTFTFESLAIEKDIRLGFQSDIAQLFTIFDRQKLEQIFTNLLSNAFKFTPCGGQIRVSLTQASSQTFVVRVEDNGSGIAQHHLPRLFDRFYQVDDSLKRALPGTGIGLALSKELVELHGGKIWAESKVGQGSVFQVSLPLAGAGHPEITQVKEVPSVKEPIAIPNNEVQPTPMSLAATRLLPIENETNPVVLLIEDNEGVRQFIASLLQGQYQILEAENGQIGVALALEQVPDLIICDVMMPLLDGYGVCRQLKSDQRTSHIPIVMLTAKAGLESKLQGLELGADEYLEKPFHSRELLIRLTNLLLNRRRLQQKYQSKVVSVEESQITAEDQTELPTVESAFLIKLRAIVVAHLSEEEFSIEDLSKEIGMSRTQVHRKLKALTDQSASIFIRQIRLQKSLELLQQPDFTISEIAYQVGFNSAIYFTHCFTEQFGKAPTEWRKTIVK